MIDQYFTTQTETETYFYMLETVSEGSQFPNLEMLSHKGSLDEFPADLEYVRTVREMPVFRKTQ